MKDFLGNGLHVGDAIICFPECCEDGNRRFVKTRIIRFCEIMVKVSTRYGERAVKPEHVIKLIGGQAIAKDI